jgi:hypothetical protein
MTTLDIMLLLCVVGVLLIALGLDIAAVLAWLRRWR